MSDSSSTAPPPPAPRDTIVAIATPPGRGGIGILRLSGPDALAIATPLLRARNTDTPLTLEPNRARFCEIIDPGDMNPGHIDPANHATSFAPSTPTKLDEAIATYFQKPNSYTGEDVLEIAAHGSPVLLDFLLRRLISLGARLANPGEFTERAFLAGRLDLTQAEAVRDLIDAQTLYQARIAASQLDGALSRRVAPIKQALIHLIAQLEAGIDFAEDDTPTLSPPAILELTTPIAAQLATLAHSFEHGRLVHSGFTLAIVGQPNVGKSSLFNRLVERERAIVTATPGTTRDLVTERLSLSGIPIELVDTAGLRTATLSGPLDEAERLGIEKSREALADADLVLLVLDANRLFPPRPGAASHPEHHPTQPFPSPATEVADHRRSSTKPATPPLAAHDPEHASTQPFTSPSAEVADPRRDTTSPTLLAVSLAPHVPSPRTAAAQPEQAAEQAAQQAAERSAQQAAERSAHSPGDPAHHPCANLETTAALLQQLEGRRAILVLNKCDLLDDAQALTQTAPPALLSQPPAPSVLSDPPADLPADLQARLALHLKLRCGYQPDLPTVATSARTIQGLDTLREAIHRQLQTPALDEQTGMLTNLRQHQSVAAALAALRAAEAAATLPHEMLLLDLYTALTHLDSLTGNTTPDDILNLIFSTFCIGK